MKIMKAFLAIVCLIISTFAKSQSTTGTADVNGIKIFYESFGDPKHETILLIQGTGVQLTEWPLEMCEALVKAGYRVVRFDNRDVGLSGKLEEKGMPDWAKVIPAIGTCDESSLPYTIADMAGDAIGLLDKLDIKKAHVVGVSMGGAIAQTMAIQYPGRLLSLTSMMASTGNPKLPQGDPAVRQVMATPPPPTDDKQEIVKYLVNMRKAMGSPKYPTPDEQLEKNALAAVNRSWYPIGSARQAAAIIIADNCDRRPLLKTIKVPVVIIHGEDDPVVSFEAAKELAATIPNSKLIAIPGMGHDLPQELISKIVDGIITATKVGSASVAKTK